MIKSAFPIIALMFGLGGCVVGSMQVEPTKYPDRQKITTYNGVEFGDDLALTANDFQCDDRRFNGLPEDNLGFHRNTGHDATDCLRLFKTGEIQLRPGQRATLK